MYLKKTLNKNRFKSKKIFLYQVTRIYCTIIKK